MKKKMLTHIENKKTTLGILIFIFCSTSYSFTNYLTIGMNPHLLPLLKIDYAIPFFPASVWIYFSEALICIAAFCLSKDLLNTTRYMLSLITVTLIALLFFIFFPTVFPRIHFPMPTDLDQYTLGLFTWLRRVDYPTNCLPSLHVAYSFLASFVFLQEQKLKFFFFFFWACLIALSTLTTKQHYFLDVAVGILFAYIMYVLFLYLFPLEMKKDIR